MSDFVPITVEREIELCGCCALVAANGDDSGCRDYYNHPDHALTALPDGEGIRLVVSDSVPDDNTHVCYGCGREGTTYAGVILSR